MKWTLPSNDVFCIKASGSVIVHVYMWVHIHSYLAFWDLMHFIPDWDFYLQNVKAWSIRHCMISTLQKGKLKYSPEQSGHNEIRNCGGAFQISNCVSLNWTPYISISLHSTLFNSIGFLPFHVAVIIFGVNHSNKNEENRSYNKYLFGDVKVMISDIINLFPMYPSSLRDENDIFFRVQRFVEREESVRI